MHALPKTHVSPRFMKVPQRFAFGLCTFKSPIGYVVVRHRRGCKTRWDSVLASAVVENERFQGS